MDHRITQCPRCGTSFRVTEAQLAVAAGAVRCGSCLHIFNARDHWAETAAAGEATAAEARPATLAPAPPPQPAEPEIEIDDDLLIDDNTPLFGDGEEEEPSPGVIFNPTDTDFASPDDGELIDDGDDLFADSLLDTSDWEPEARSSLLRELDDIDPGLDEGGIDERWAEQLLADDAKPEQIDAPARSSIFDDYEDTLPTSPRTENTDETGNTEKEEEAFLDIPSAFDPGLERLRAVDEPKPAERAPEPEPEPDPAVDPLFAAPLRAEERIGGTRPMLGGIEPEPLQLHTFVREPRWPSLLWGFAALLAVALFAGQYLYFNFDRLARGELRPWLVNVCATLNCRVPPRYDLARIRTSSLIVRSHPTERGALAVDAILTNLADFGQPYPVLQLQFTDLDGRPVAGRRFQPAEYLGGELSGAELMPVQQPVHIALEVVDPGPRAVNYLLTVAAQTGGQ